MIRYTNKINKDINRIVRNYNQRIEYVKNKNKYGIYYVPDKINVKELKNSVTNKRDLNRRLKDLQSYNIESAKLKDGKSFSIYEYNLKKKYRDILRRDINKEMKYYETTPSRSFGRESGLKLAQTENRKYLNLVAKKYNLLNKSIEDVKLSTLIANTNMRESKFLENFKDILKFNADIYDLKGYDELLKKLENMSNDEFYEFYKRDKSLQQLLYYYNAVADLEVQEIEDITTDVQQIFDNIIENIEDIFKG